MSKTASKLTFLAIVASALLLSATTLEAQTKTTEHYKEVHYEVSSDGSLLGDPADGHYLGVWVRKGLTIFETGEVAAYSAFGYIDITKGNGMISGHDETIFADGSSWSTKFEGQFSVGAKGLWVIPHKGEFIKGTGRYEGIQGTLTYTSKQINSAKDFAGLAETEGTAIYTLPSK